jgi:DNA-binding Lrp family transcriptional regulator
MPDLDNIDHQILELLRRDARRTVKDIAARVNLSPAPVKRRIERMERERVITGYTVRLDHAKVGPSLEAFTELRYSGDVNVEEIFEGLCAVDEVQDAYTTAGDPDALVHLRVHDVSHLQRVIARLRGGAHLVGTKTLIVMERRAGPASGR